MIFEDFIREGKVIIGTKDTQKAKALIKMSENNIKAAEAIELTETTASPVFKKMLSQEALTSLSSLLNTSKRLSITPFIERGIP